MRIFVVPTVETPSPIQQIVELYNEIVKFDAFPGRDAQPFIIVNPEKTHDQYLITRMPNYGWCSKVRDFLRIVGKQGYLTPYPMIVNDQIYMIFAHPGAKQMSIELLQRAKNSLVGEKE